MDSAAAVLNLFVRAKEDKGRPTKKTPVEAQRHEEKASVDETMGTKTNGTSGWRLDPQNALNAAVNNNIDSGTSESVSFAAAPSGDNAASEADSSYLTEFKNLLAGGLELQRVKSYGTRIRHAQENNS